MYSRYIPSQQIAAFILTSFSCFQAYAGNDEAMRLNAIEDEILKIKRISSNENQISEYPTLSEIGVLNKAEWISLNGKTSIKIKEIDSAIENVVISVSNKKITKTRNDFDFGFNENGWNFIYINSQCYMVILDFLTKDYALFKTYRYPNLESSWTDCQWTPMTPPSEVEPNK